MAKRKKKAPDPPAGVPAWMATFSDLVTLLLTFFVMLMAMASFDESSALDAAMESLRQALAQAGFGEGLLSSIMGDNLSDEAHKDTTAKPLEARPRPAMEGGISMTVARVDKTEQDVRLTLDDPAYFASGRHEVRPEARRRLNELGRLVVDHGVDIRIEGHADRDGEEAANWRLSTLRALSVLEVFRDDARIPADRLEARGFGSFRPVATRDEDAARNRRIEVVLTGTDSETAATIADLQAAGWIE